MKKLLPAIVLCAIVVFACSATAGAKTTTLKSLAKSVATLQKTVKAQTKQITTLQKQIADRKLLSGSGTPAASFGAVGDFYLDTLACQFYGPKTSSGWSAPTSLKGAQGDAGATGPQGPKGDTGATGPQGPKGDNGAQGTAGIAGSQGTAGIAGASWCAASGIPADSLGCDGDFYLDKASGDVYQKASGFWGHIVNLTGAQGLKGDTGVTGPQGTQGPKGDTGAAGPQGTQGLKGDTGATGSQGLKGDTGAQGATGTQGLKGDTGATGPQGPQGTDLRTVPALAGLFALAPYVSVNQSSMDGVAGPNIFFQGANVHVLSSSWEEDTTGTGNLIVGWNEAGYGARTGSNNLVCGNHNTYPACGCFIDGNYNTVGALYSSVSGGQQNTASQNNSSVCGGLLNTASGYFSTVSGGHSVSDSDGWGWSAGGSFHNP